MSTPLFQHDQARLCRSWERTRLDRDRAEALARWREQQASLPKPEPEGSREDLLTLERLQDQFAREQAALERRLSDPPERCDRRDPLVVVAHRYDWASTTLVAGFTARGWTAVDVYGDAASAVAALIVLAPDVLLCTDRLLGASGMAVLPRALELAPDTRLVVQVDEERRAAQLRDIGVHIVLPHRMIHADVVHLVDELAASEDAPEPPLGGRPSPGQDLPSHPIEASQGLTG